jgi:hypothetical protein
LAEGIAQRRDAIAAILLWPSGLIIQVEQAPCRCCQRFANEMRKPNEDKRDQLSSDSSGFTGFFDPDARS